MEQKCLHSPNINTNHKLTDRNNSPHLRNMKIRDERRKSSYIPFNIYNNHFKNKINNDIAKINQNINTNCCSLKNNLFLKKHEEHLHDEKKQIEKNDNDNVLMRKSDKYKRGSAFISYTPIFKVVRKKSNSNNFLLHYSLANNNFKKEDELSHIPENNKDSESLEKRKQQIKKILHERRKSSEKKHEEENLNKGIENKSTNNKSSKKENTETKIEKNLINNNENHGGNNIENINSMEKGKINEAMGINIYNIKKENKEKIKKKKSIKSFFLCCFNGQNDSSIEEK